MMNPFEHHAVLDFLFLCSERNQEILESVFTLYSRGFLSEYRSAQFSFFRAQTEAFWCACRCAALLQRFAPKSTEATFSPSFNAEAHPSNTTNPPEYFGPKTLKSNDRSTAHFPPKARYQCLATNPLLPPIVTRGEPRPSATRRFFTCDGGEVLRFLRQRSPASHLTPEIGFGESDDCGGTGA